MGGLKARLAFRWEAMQLRFSHKRFGFWIMFNLFAVLLISALVTFFLERGRNPGIHSYWDALYMVFITIATVGYGDITPVTAGGRVNIIITLVLGIGALSGFITLMATKRTEKAKRRYSGLDVKTTSKDHIVVCGWNSKGRYVIGRLKDEFERERVQIVLLCDLEESPVEDDYTFFLRGNPVNEADLRRANVAEARTVILLADESKGGESSDADARTVLSALTVRDIRPEAKMVAEALEPENIHHLKLAGVGEILDTNSLLGNLIAKSALHYGLITTVSDLVSMGADKSTFTVLASEDMLGRTRREVVEMMLREHGARLLSIITARGLTPYDDGYRLAAGDRLVVIAEKPPPGAVSG